MAVNECWIGDAKQIDVACLHNGKVIFPWFTAFMDARSRKFVGWVLSAVHNSLTIGQAFAYGCAKYGPPTEIYVDRGKPYRSQFIAGKRVKESDEELPFEETETAGVVREMGSSIFSTAPYNGKEKIIEPNFNWCARLKGCKGDRGNKIENKPAKFDREYKNRDLLTLEQFSKIFDEKLHARNARQHSQTKKSPDSFYEGFIGKIPSQEILDYLLMDRHTRRVKDGTVSIEGFLYRGEKLWELAGESVEVRRDPRDLRRAVIVYKGKPFCRADLEVPGHYRDPITAEHAKTARRIRRDIKRRRQEMIDGEAVSTDTVKLAAELAEANQERPRDIRPAQSKVRGFHAKEGLARDVRKILTTPLVEEPEELQAAAGGDIITRFTNACMPRTEKVILSLESISGPLSFFDSNDNGGF